MWVLHAPPAWRPRRALGWRRGPARPMCETEHHSCADVHASTARLCRTAVGTRRAVCVRAPLELSVGRDLTNECVRREAYLYRPFHSALPAAHTATHCAPLIGIKRRFSTALCRRSTRQLKSRSALLAPLSPTVDGSMSISERAHLANSQMARTAGRRAPRAITAVGLAPHGPIQSTHRFAAATSCVLSVAGRASQPMYRQPILYESSVIVSTWCHQ